MFYYMKKKSFSLKKYLTLSTLILGLFFLSVSVYFLFFRLREELSLRAMYVLCSEMEEGMGVLISDTTSYACGTLGVEYHLFFLLLLVGVFFLIWGANSFFFKKIKSKKKD